VALDLAPGQTLPLAFEAALNKRLGVREREACSVMTVVVKAILGPWGQQPVEGVPGSHEASAEVKIPVRCRTARQSFLFGFVDHDGVAGIAAAIAPRLANAKAKANAKANAQAPEFSRAPVVLSLSGVGASPASHADAHKHKTSPGAPFLFGLSKA